jgi:hypothetical protein
MLKGIFGTVAIISGLFLAGCVERELTIKTLPTGAMVTLNDEEIGAAPVTTSFLWYGDYRVRVSKQGYETLITHRSMDRPLHDKFPFDFFAESLWPGRIHDTYTWTFELKPYVPPSRDELINAAVALKKEAVAVDANVYGEANKPAKK